MNHDTVLGIGVIGAYTVGQETRMIGNLTETSADFGKIIGYENHSGQTFLRDGVQPLGTVDRHAQADIPFRTQDMADEARHDRARQHGADGDAQRLAQKRDERRARAEADEVALRQVQQHLGLDRVQVLGYGDVCHIGLPPSMTVEN